MFLVQTPELDAYLIDAIPGAREALDRWKAFADSSEAVELAAAVRAAMNARVGKVRRVDGRLAPIASVTQAAFDQLAADLAAAHAAEAAYVKQRLAARAEYEALVTSSAIAAVGGHALSAQVALDRHADAEAAFDQLLRMLGERDRAYSRAGANRGRAWSATDRDSGAYAVMHSRSAAEQFFRAALDRFDTRALAAVANAEVSE